MEQKGIDCLGFLKVRGSIMEQKRVGNIIFLELLVLQSKSHPHFIIYVHSKSKVTRKTGRHSLWGTKTCSERSHLAGGRLMKLFPKTTTNPRQPLLCSQEWSSYTALSAQSCHHNPIFHQLSTSKLKEIVISFFLNVYNWENFQIYLQIVNLHKMNLFKNLPNLEFFPPFGSATRELSTFINRILKSYFADV